MRPPRIPRVVLKGKRRPNTRRAAKHLAFIRRLSCVACGRAAPSEAAHVRRGTDGGTALKPSDKFSVPLCTECHATQHGGELTFWTTMGSLNPLDLAASLWAVSGDVEAGERIVYRILLYLGQN